MPTRRTVRPDTLHCSGCNQWKPDDDFHQAGSYHARRYRTYRCKDCGKRKKDATEQPGTLLCAICGSSSRKPSQYVCWFCSNNEMFNHVRPPEMQGRAVSIFTGRPSCPPPPIKPEREPAYWSRVYAGAK